MPQMIFSLRIFSQIDFCLQAYIKIVRLLLAALGSNGLMFVQYGKHLEFLLIITFSCNIAAEDYCGLAGCKWWRKSDYTAKSVA